MGKKVISKDFLSILDGKDSSIDSKTIIEDTNVGIVETDKTHEKLLRENKDLKAELFELKEELERYKKNQEVAEKLSSIPDADKKYKSLLKEYEEFKQKVKRDLRLVQERERELSNRIEILKQDNQALLHSKDNQILKLKKKLDDMNYQLSTAQDKIKSLTKLKNDYEDKLKQILRSLKISASLIEAVQKDIDSKNE